MSENKYVVPVGMVDAAYQFCPASFARPAVAAMLQAAIKWLADNPVIPTREQELALHDFWSLSIKPRSDAGGEIASQIRFSVIEWQRLMFLAPEPPPDPLVMYIMRHFDDAETDERSRRNRAEAAISDFKEHVKRNKMVVTFG